MTPHVVLSGRQQAHGGCELLLVVALDPPPPRRLPQGGSAEPQLQQRVREWRRPVSQL